MSFWILPHFSLDIMDAVVYMAAKSPLQQNAGYAATSLEFALDDISLFIMISIGFTDTLSHSLVSSSYAVLPLKVSSTPAPLLASSCIPM